MTAHPSRHAVLVRMYPEALRKLDALCAHREKQRGGKVWRSELMNELVAAAWSRLPADVQAGGWVKQPTAAQRKKTRSKPRRKRKR